MATSTAGLKNLFDVAASEEIKARLQRLRPDSPREWGKMTPAQALAHCSASIEMALGDTHPPQMLIGRVLGRIIKPFALGDDKPMKRNSPTVPSFVVGDERDFVAERAKLTSLIDRFSAGGPAACTTHPHSFFGPMKPQEWAILMYKHLDHHLRQFGV
jgi:hypothetical protein